MRETVFHDLHRLYPQRISNKTNGVSFRRWLFQANPLTELLVETLGADLLDTGTAPAGPRGTRRGRQAAGALRRAAPAEQDRPGAPGAGQPRRGDRTGSAVRCAYRAQRQLLNLLHTVALYQEIRNDPTADRVPRVKIAAARLPPATTRPS